MLHRGTLSLDEIADLRPLLQPKLLRVLETHRVEPMDATQSVPTDFSAIVLTQRNKLTGNLRRQQSRHLGERLCHCAHPDWHTDA